MNDITSEKEHLVVWIDLLNCIGSNIYSRLASMSAAIVISVSHLINIIFWDLFSDDIFKIT